ncbi:PH domain-containing protein [Eikenella corrodens]|nr:PH domain-containing protein [Eikenella corrodens]
MMEDELRISFFRCSLWLLPKAAVFLGFAFLLLSKSDSAAYDTFAYVLLWLFAAVGGLFVLVWLRCITGFRPVVLTQQGVVLRSVWGRERLIRWADIEDVRECTIRANGWSTDFAALCLRGDSRYAPYDCRHAESKKQVLVSYSHVMRGGHRNVQQQLRSALSLYGAQL